MDRDDLGPSPLAFARLTGAGLALTKTALAGLAALSAGPDLNPQDDHEYPDIRIREQQNHPHQHNRHLKKTCVQYQSLSLYRVKPQPPRKIADFRNPAEKFRRSGDDPRRRVGLSTASL